MFNCTKYVFVRNNCTSWCLWIYGEPSMLFILFLTGGLSLLYKLLVTWYRKGKTDSYMSENFNIWILKTEFTIIWCRPFFCKRDECSHMTNEKGSLQFVVVFCFDYIIEVKAMIGKALHVKGQHLVLQILILNTIMGFV